MQPTPKDSGRMATPKPISADQLLPIQAASFLPQLAQNRAWSGRSAPHTQHRGRATWATNDRPQLEQNTAPGSGRGPHDEQSDPLRARARRISCSAASPVSTGNISDARAPAFSSASMAASAASEYVALRRA